MPNIQFFTDNGVEELDANDVLNVVSSSIDCGNNNNNNHRRHRHHNNKNNGNNQ
jgi:hypothetical protein